MVQGEDPGLGIRQPTLELIYNLSDLESFNLEHVI